MIGWNLFQGLVLLALLSTGAGWFFGYGKWELHRRSWWPAAYCTQSGVSAVILTIWTMMQGVHPVAAVFVGLLPVMFSAPMLFIIRPSVSYSEPTAPGTRLRS